MKEPEKRKRINLRYAIWLSFTGTAAIAALFISLSLYSRFNSQLQSTIQKENQSIIEQVNNTLTVHLRSMMKISDSLYYNVLKNVDMETDSISDEIQLLYDTNNDSVSHIALFDEQGNLIDAAPAAVLKDTAQVTGSMWYETAMEKTENLHFANPSIQNLFQSTKYDYQWVISLSRAVQINQGKQTVSGVLLIDIKYSKLRLIFNDVTLGNDGYLYLIDRDGSIIYHPMSELIASNIIKENNLVAAGYKDGNYEEVFDDGQRIVTVKSVGYTGWKIIGVTPKDKIELNSLKSNLFIAFLILFFITILFIINSYISAKVSKPIKMLEKSVELLAKGDLDTQVEIVGVHEVRHLGESIQTMATQIKRLLNDSVKAEKTKRKNELDILQSQINPHFLYNTLDTIVWMIENEKKTDATKAVIALSKFFRISLSKGKNIISLKDEVEHVRNYLMIQNMRYKNKFTYTIDVDESLEQYAIIKLVLQPLVENAIYHGMEFMDGEGEINIHAYKEEEDLFISVKDNGFGMTDIVVDKILGGEIESKSKGSGIGFKNVQERIKLQFGKKYGLIIITEPDEGTNVIIHIPAILYTDLSYGESTHGKS